MAHTILTEFQSSKTISHLLSKRLSDDKFLEELGQFKKLHYTREMPSAINTWIGENDITNAEQQSTDWDLR